ncbi:polyprenyl synthetase family protein [Carboxydocella sp. JDF658]|uniref:polyprenyl synthetase family protein n=1 Tax=Carboxydocella sp. JDF658 TaxID=1926600 RepID=UPI0009AC62EB|nr:farnesyl diphosphate synthase [Carboxydocella sp. JDF658]GAW30817.1 farnesyl-diphosphate synthase [Carboxydocella sp. JDF658]
MDLQKWQEQLLAKNRLVEDWLEEVLPGPELEPGRLHEAMLYSLFAGGKRLRPALVLGAVEAVGGEVQAALPAAAALEMIHTYSLIHDDLPAMDNDDYRRGKPTNHKVFGEATAILAGDALLTLAFELLAAHLPGAGVSPEIALRVIREIAEAAGTQGMIGGQMADMEAQGQQVNGEQLEKIHRRKTGALFRAAVRVGGLIGGATPEQLAALSHYAEQLGLAFQITDDILDITGDPAKMGKDKNSDLKNCKATYPSLYGLEQARIMAEKAVTAAIKTLGIFGAKAEFLKETALFLLKREQ